MQKTVYDPKKSVANINMERLQVLVHEWLNHTGLDIQKWDELR